MPTSVVVLGGGFGGLEVASQIGRECESEADVTLIDQSPHFIFGFSKFDVMFGRLAEPAVRHAYRGVGGSNARFVQADVTAIDPQSRRVTTTAGVFDADVLVVALGANLDPAATPGLLDSGYEFYTPAGAFALRDVLDRFPGGRVVVGVTSAPFKCPPAPSECALLMHEFLADRGLRDESHISLVMPFGAPIPPSPVASRALLSSFAERGISWIPNRRITTVEHGSVVLDDETSLGCDLLLAVPVHRAPQVVVDAGMTVDGWIPVDPYTLETAFPKVYAVGDITSVGTPKAGVFAEGQAAVAAQRIIAAIRGEQPQARYDGHGVCYLEFGAGEVATVDVVFEPGKSPVGDMIGPSPALVKDKTEFAQSRLARWFSS